MPISPVTAQLWTFTATKKKQFFFSPRLFFSLVLKQKLIIYLLLRSTTQNSEHFVFHFYIYVFFFCPMISLCVKQFTKVASNLFRGHKYTYTYFIAATILPILNFNDKLSHLKIMLNFTFICVRLFLYPSQIFGKCKCARQFAGILSIVIYVSLYVCVCVYVSVCQ